MPVQQTRGHAGKALLIASVSVVLLLGLAFLVAQAANRGDVEIHIGDDTFDAGKVSAISDSIAEEDGLPLLFQDLTGRTRNLYVQHLSDDDEEGWVAFAATETDDPSCHVEIDREVKILHSSCDRDRTYPLNGEGLRPYPSSVQDGRLIVDINEVTTSSSSSTSSTSTTSTSAP